MEEKMIHIRNLGEDLRNLLSKFESDIAEIKEKVGLVEVDSVEEKELKKGKSKSKKLVALLVATLFLASSPCFALIMDDNVSREAEIDLSKIDITAQPENSEYTNGNLYLHLPEVATASLPAGAAGNEGAIVYDATTDTVKYSDGTAWANIAIAGGATLDTAYNGGSAIDVDTNAVTMTVSDTDNNEALTITQNDTTNNPNAMSIVNAGTGDSLLINGVAGSNDINGDNWSVTQAGAITGTSLGVSGAVNCASVVSTGAISGTAITGSTGTYSGNASWDDGAADSPTLTLVDGSDETVVLQKIDSGNLDITTLAADGVRVMVGNLRVGNGTPGVAAMNGEDAYIEGELEVDGAVQLDGAVVIGTSLSLSDQNITNVGSIALDSIVGDGTAIAIGATAGHDVTVGNSTGNFGVTSDNADFTLTDTTDNAFQLVNSGGAIVFDVDLGAADQITIGSGAEAVAINSSNIDISNAGAITGATGISTSGALASTGTFDVDGGANISDTTAGSNVAIGNSTGDVAVVSDNCDITCTDATDNVFQVLNAAGSVVYVDLDLGAADGLTLGNAAGTLGLASSSWSVSTAGVIENTVSIELEGSSVDAADITLSAEDPTANRAIELPDYAGAIPLVIYNGTAAVDCTGVGATTDITGSELSLLDGWFTAGKALKWTIYGRTDGSGGQAMALQIYIDDGAFCAVNFEAGQSDDFVAEFVLDEHTDAANQDILGKLLADTFAPEVDVDVDTTDFNDGGATGVKLQGTTNHAADHIYIDHIVIEHWSL